MTSATKLTAFLVVLLVAARCWAFTEEDVKQYVEHVQWKANEIDQLIREDKMSQHGWAAFSRFYRTFPEIPRPTIPGTQVLRVTDDQIGSHEKSLRSTAMALLNHEKLDRYSPHILVTGRPIHLLVLQVLSDDAALVKIQDLAVSGVMRDKCRRSHGDILHVFGVEAQQWIDDERVLDNACLARRKPYRYTSVTGGSRSVESYELIDRQAFLEAIKEYEAAHPYQWPDWAEKPGIQSKKAKPEPREEPLRTWTSSDGRYQVKAKFVKATPRGVTLEKEGGAEIKVPLNRLSEEDIDWLKKRARR